MNKQKLHAIMADHFGHSEITSRQRLHEDLGADSLDIVDMSQDIEEEWDIGLSDKQIAGWVTVGDIEKDLNL